MVDITNVIFREIQHLRSGWEGKLYLLVSMDILNYLHLERSSIFSFVEFGGVAEGEIHMGRLAWMDVYVDLALEGNTAMIVPTLEARRDSRIGSVLGESDEIGAKKIKLP
jgi:hypothetical protein